MQILKRLLIPAPALRCMSQFDNSSLHHVIQTALGWGRFGVVGTAALARIRFESVTKELPLSVYEDGERIPDREARSACVLTRHGAVKV